MTELTVAPVPPDEMDRAIDRLAELRIMVFRAFPYLYDGDPAYERRYLAPYAESDGAMIVGAWDGARMVGAATGAPMEDHAKDFAGAFDGTAYVLEDIYYCGESVLLSDFRGRGVGHAFFDQREARARTLGRRWSAFCNVLRPAYHPQRPADYSPLDPFWRERGYIPLDDVTASFAWRDRGEAVESDKTMQFWIRDLDA